jgi:hypothetical protein
MFINELAEPTLIVIYPGRFQPFHKGHFAVYQHLATKYGRNNVYIATSNKTDNVKSPFTFAEKSYFMQLTGVPADRIIQTTQPYQISSVAKDGNLTLDLATTVAIFAVSQKDMAEDPRFSFAPKKDGLDPYFQPLKRMKDTKSIAEHAYIETVPTFDFTVNGKPMRSATELRVEYKDADEKTRQKIVADLFGKYTQEAEQLLTSKLAPKAPVQAPRPTQLPKTVKPAGGIEAVNEMGGVGVVKGSNDPRYCMATAGDQNDVDGNTLNKEMQAYGLVGRTSPGGKTQQKAIKGSVGRGVKESAIDQLEQRRIEDLNAIMDEIKQRITTEQLPAKYVEALKQRLLKLKTERDSYYRINT